MKNNMEQQFKKLEDFEFDFNPDHLELMNQRLDAEFGPVSKPSVWKSVWFKGAAAVAVVTGIAVSAYFLTKDDNTSSQLSEGDVQHSEEIVNNDVTPVDNNNIIEPAVANNGEEGTSANNEIDADDNTPVVDQNDAKQDGATNPVDETPVKQDGNKPQDSNKQNNASPTPKVIKANTTFKVSKRVTCPGDAIAFYVENPTKGFSYHWEFSDGSVKVGSSVKHSFELSGNYDVNLVAINNKDQGNISRTKHDRLIKVHGTGNATILVNDDDLSIKDPYTKFSLSEGFEGTVAWNFGNGMKGSGNTSEVYFENKGAQKVVAQLTTKEGCKTTLQKDHFNNYEVDLFAPNAFRPVAGNTQKGRTFIPGALTTGDVMFTMIIKDQNGQTVYSTTSSDEPWSGKLNNNGELLPEGVYAWTVIYKDKNGQPFTQRGRVKLLKN